MDSFGDYGSVSDSNAIRRRQASVVVILVLAVAIAVLLAGALGLLGDSDTVSAPDAITDGSVALATSKSAATLSNAAPGDSFYMFVSVQNTGSLNSRVAVTTEVPPDAGGDPADEALSQGLYLDAQWNAFSEST